MASKSPAPSRVRRGDSAKGQATAAPFALLILHLLLTGSFDSRYTELTRRCWIGLQRLFDKRRKAMRVLFTSDAIAKIFAHPPPRQFREDLHVLLAVFL